MRHNRDRCRILVATGEHDHSQVGEPNEAESKDKPQQGREEASPGRRDASELVHNVLVQYTLVFSP